MSIGTPGFARRAVTAALLLMAAAATGAQETPAAPATPEACLNAFVAAVNARASARAAGAFSTDAELMLPDAPPARGREAVAATLEAYLGTARIVDVLSTTVTRSGGLAVASGRLTLTTRTRMQGADVRGGSYLAAFRRTNAGWTITHLSITLPLQPDFVG